VVGVCAVAEETLELSSIVAGRYRLHSRLEATKATVIGDPTQITNW
jgi:hypothetical protein